MGEGAGAAGDCARAAFGDGKSGRGGIGGAFEGRSGVAGLALLNKGVSGSHEAGGILRTSVHPHFIVQMNAGRATG